jgi:predicted TIM-barrel fold metal-dependent hydrolase
VLRRHPGVRLILAHCGGALPALTGRLRTLGAEPWVPNPGRLTPQEITDQLARLYLDTAASGTRHPIAAALAMTSADHLVYGTDWGAPCTTETTMDNTWRDLRANPLLTDAERDVIWHNALHLLPSAAARLGS